MERTQFARTGRDVSRIGLGCWQLGGDWGTVEESAAEAILQQAVDSGIIARLPLDHVRGVC